MDEEAPEVGGVGWGGGAGTGRDGTRASPLLFSYRSIVRLSETGPVLLWLQAFRLRFKPSTSGTSAQV